LATLYVEVFRRIPFLVKLMCVFFAYQLSGASVSLFTVAATTVALSAAAFSAENVRAGLESIGRTQWEAAETMNMAGLVVLLPLLLAEPCRCLAGEPARPARLGIRGIGPGPR
jgi:polar amino acid transport system permease protein